MTRLRRLLGTLLRVGFAEAVAYRGEFVVWLLATNTPLIMLVLWHAVAAEGPVGRYGQPEFTAYFLVTLIVRLLTGAWVVWEINTEVRSGQLAMRLMRPVHPFLAYAAENLAAWPLRLLMTLPVAGVALWAVGPRHFAHDARQWLVFLVMLASAWLLNFASMAAIGSLAFFWQSSVTAFEVWLALFFVLSGYIVPLDLFPPALARAADWLPFRYIIAAPVETALGSVGLGGALWLLAHQWLYIAGVGLAALALWRRGVRRWEAFGG